MNLFYPMKKYLILLGAILLFTLNASAQPMNYQGRLTDTNGNILLTANTHSPLRFMMPRPAAPPSGDHFKTTTPPAPAMALAPTWSMAVSMF